MTTVKYTDEEALVEKAIDALLRDLGPVDAARFMSMPRAKRIESVKRHRAWQETLQKDKFFAEIFATNEKNK